MHCRVLPETKKNPPNKPVPIPFSRRHRPPSSTKEASKKEAKGAHDHPVLGVRPIGEIAFWTGTSRGLGFFRDLILAAVLGAGPVVEAFIIALRLPNLFRRTFAEGAFNTAFLPLYAQHRGADESPDQNPDQNQGDEQQARDFARAVFAFLLVAMVVLLVLFWAVMPWVITVLGPGLAEGSEERALAILYARITFPYLLLTALTTWFAAVCNAHGFFAGGAIAPIFFNACLVIALLLFAQANPQDLGLALSVGVTLSGFCQAGFMFWVCKTNTGITPAWQRPRITPGIRRLLRAMGPSALSVGVFQINFLVAMAVVSFKEGGISHLYYAERVYQLPVALIGLAISAVLLSDLSDKLSRGQEHKARGDFNRALEASLFFVLPATVGLVVLRQPIASVLFERGAFTGADAAGVAGALGAFALGLPAYVATRILQTPFFAQSNTRTPAKTAMAGAALSILATVPLFLLFAASGVALATSLGGWLTACLLYRKVQQRLGWHSDSLLTKNLARMLVASLLMGGVLFFLHRAFAPALSADASEWARWGALFGLIALGVGLYFFCALILGASRSPALARLTRRRKRHLKQERQQEKATTLDPIDDQQ